MEIGFLGLGKLGLPCALAAESRGHHVRGTDADPVVRHRVQTRSWPHREAQVSDLLAESRLELVGISDLVVGSELVFVVVATPHAPGLDGSLPLTDERHDFDYADLVTAIADLVDAAARIRWTGTIAIVSTVLPGTVDRVITPIVGDQGRLAYNPSFASMGQVVADYRDPEFVLVGSACQDAVETLRTYYSVVTTAPIIEVPVIDAELAKVAYNTFIGLKIVYANALMELSHKLGADSDNVAAILGRASRRIVSPAYMLGGLGDGGPCHPRDSLALSWLARTLDLSHDIFEDVMVARERQTEWIAELVDEFEGRVVVLGKAFKAETNLTTGSAATLLARIIESRGRAVRAYDPFIDAGPPPLDAEVFVVATNHRRFADVRFPPGAVVIDPWGLVTPDHDNVELVRVGRGKQIRSHAGAHAR